MQLQNVETSKRIDPYRKCSEKRVDVLISNKYNKYNAQTPTGRRELTKLECPEAARLGVGELAKTSEDSLKVRGL